jgi:hypothetical protein
MTKASQTWKDIADRHSDRISGRSSYLIPPDATHKRMGLYYKRGRHGLVFKWSGVEWTRASLTPSQLSGYEVSIPKP